MAAKFPRLIQGEFPGQRLMVVIHDQEHVVPGPNLKSREANVVKCQRITMLESDLHAVKARSQTVITFACLGTFKADGLGCCFSHAWLEIDVLDLR